MTDGVRVEWDVSRETALDFDRYVDLLRKWSPRINLVAPNTLESAEIRHIQDSLQLLRHVTLDHGLWVDLGSGAGFPGLAVAIALKDTVPEMRVHLVESDHRKAAFLRTVSRETSTLVTIHSHRAEELSPLSADIVSARALAPLPRLLPLVHRHLKPGGIALLPKGANYAKELAAASEEWDFSCEELPSVTQAEAVILKIGALRHG